MKRLFWVIAGLTGLVVVAVVVTVSLTATAEPGCACAIPPSDDEAIATAQEYVADVGEDSMLADSAAAPSPGRAEHLALLDDPGTSWVVLALLRPDGGSGRSPAERLVVGTTPEGEVDAVVVHTDTDYRPGTVDPAVEITEADPLVARSGPFPIFGELELGMSESVRGRLAVLSLTGGPITVAVVEPGGAWAYTGQDPLNESRYRALTGGRGPDGWHLRAGWFSPDDPVTAPS